MNIVYSILKNTLIIFIGVSSLIMLPQLLTLIIVLIPTYYLANKICYTNTTSNAFGIDKNNTISSKLGKNIFFGAVAKNKNDYLKVELTNAVIDMEPEVEYNTTSNANVKRVLNKLEKEGYISEFKVEELNQKLLVNNFVNNLALGNIDNLLNLKTNYKMSFVRTDKVINNNITDCLYMNHYNIKDKDLEKIELSYTNKEVIKNSNLEESKELLKLQELRNVLINKLNHLNNLQNSKENDYNQLENTLVNLKTLSNNKIKNVA